MIIPYSLQPTAFNDFIARRSDIADAAALLASPALGDILKYHVLGSEVPASVAFTVNGNNKLDVLKTLQPENYC